MPATDVHLSKTLSWLLRHKLQVSTDGYISVANLLNHESLKGKYTVADIKRVVETNNKQRFTLRYKNNTLEICANQGHSIKYVDLYLIPILTSDGIEAIHGTYYHNWTKIKTEGLSRMQRNHIHFAIGLPDNKSVISGMRRQVEVFIYVNLNLAILDGIKFYKSSNGVILSSGNDRGIIEPKYFLKVCDVNGKSLF
ncbi:hypothetical protein NQ314_013487 [Rhamnusium bicolor]|uniref:2'-phosphotransferase n=1 Tax=Rhamnusium bicolor TaxID=1586634 RepID=A0AAV8X5M5_9CUCU|nr:hypothetical protein NQ314_013487 [Rhamnusium bicolor]